MVCGDAVEQGMWAAGIFTHIAADSARALTTRVGYIVKSLRVQGVAQVQIDQSRLYNCAEIVVINLEDAIHASKNDDDSAIDGNGAAAQTCPCSSWHDRHIIMSCYFDYSGHVLCRGGQDHNIRCTAVDRGIIFVQHQVIGRMQDVARSKQRNEIMHYFLFFGFRNTFIQGRSCWWSCGDA